MFSDSQRIFIVSVVAILIIIYLIKKNDTCTKESFDDGVYKIRFQTESDINPMGPYNGLYPLLVRNRC